MRVKARERPKRPQLSIAPKRSEDLNPDNHACYPSRGKTEAHGRSSYSQQATDPGGHPSTSQRRDSITAQHPAEPPPHDEEAQASPRHTQPSPHSEVWMDRCLHIASSDPGTQSTSPPITSQPQHQAGCRK